MPRIIAICPYCRRGGVRARDTAIGASAHCPKCKSSFTVLPEDNPPDWAAKANVEAEFFYQSSPLAETRAAKSLPDRTEPSPVVTAESTPEKPKLETPPASVSPVTPPPQAVSTASGEPPRAPADTAMVIALAVLIMIGPTALLSQLPPGRFIAIPLSVVGLIAALLCLGAETKARLAAAAAAFLHFIMLVVLLFLPSWLNLEPWQGAPAEEEQKVPMAMPNDGGPGQPAEWVDGGTSSWEFNDARVSVRGAFIGPAELVGPKQAKRKTKETYLQLSVRVANTGAARRIALSGWATGDSFAGVRFTDPTGNEVKLKTFTGGWTPELEHPVQSGLFPSKSTDLVLLFEGPLTKSGTYQLELPGVAFESAQPVRFRFTSAFLGVRP